MDKKSFVIIVVSIILLFAWFVPSIIDHIDGETGHWGFFYICLFFTCAHWYDKVTDYIERKGN